MRLGSGVTLYGLVEIGGGSLIEDGVVIGHPSPELVATVRRDGADDEAPSDLYRRIGGRVVIGPNARILSGTVIYSDVTIGPDFDCGHNVIVREGVRIGSSCYLKSGTEVQKRVQIFDRCRIGGLVGDDSIIESGVSTFGLLVHSHRSHVEQGHSRELAPMLRGGCIVGRSAVVIGGVEVGSNAVVGAGTVVTRDVPDGMLCVGPSGVHRSKSSR